MLYKRPTWNRPWLIQWLNSTFKSRSAWVFSCLNASRYPPPHPLLWLRDRIYQPPSYLTLDLRARPLPIPHSSSSFLSLLLPPGLGQHSAPLGFCRGSEFKKVPRRYKHSSDIPVSPSSTTVGFRHCAEIALCLNIQGPSPQVVIRAFGLYQGQTVSYVRTAVGMENLESSQLSLLQGRGHELATKICSCFVLVHVLLSKWKHCVSLFVHKALLMV